MRVPNALRGCTKATVVPRGAATWRGVDQLSTRRSHLLHRPGAVGGRGTQRGGSPLPSREELRHRGAFRRRAEQLDVGLCDFEQCLLDSIPLDALAMGEVGPERRLVPGNRLVQVEHGDSDVIDLGQGR